MVNLQVHLVQYLLHMLEVERGQLNEIVAMTPQRADRADFVVWAKRSSHQAHRMNSHDPNQPQSAASKAWPMLLSLSRRGEKGRIGAEET
jgi:hypothetical protein